MKYLYILLIIMILHCNICCATPQNITYQWENHSTEYIVTDETLDDITYKFLSDNVNFAEYREAIIADNYTTLNDGRDDVHILQNGDKLIIHYWIRKEN